MASRSSACLLLALAVAHATVVAAAPATTSVTAEAPRHQYSDELLSRKFEILAPAAGEALPKPAAECVKTVLETSRPCACDVLLTLVFGSVHLSQGCCDVLAGVGDKCVADVLSAVPQLGPALLPVVNRICGFVATVL